MGVIILVVIINLVNFKFTRGQELLIVGGRYSKAIEDFAYSVYLYIECDLGDRTHYFICGASIVNQAILLTAGHCLDECMPTTIIEAHAGSVNRNKGSVHLTSKFKIHEKYHPRSLSNDIALVKLADKLKFGKYVRRIALMSKPPYFEPAIVAGWGNTDEVSEKSSDWLKYISQKVWYHQNCRKAGLRLPYGTFCAGTLNGSNHASLGDSGSPLVVRKLIQIGLVSFRNDRVSKSLTVYTDVGLFFNWIKKEAKKLFCSRT